MSESNFRVIVDVAAPVATKIEAVAAMSTVTVKFFSDIASSSFLAYSYIIAEITVFFNRITALQGT